MYGVGDLNVNDPNFGVMTNPDPLAGLSPDWYSQLVGPTGPPASAVSGSGQVVFSPAPAPSIPSWVWYGLGGFAVLMLFSGGRRR